MIIDIYICTINELNLLEVIKAFFNNLYSLIFYPMKRKITILMLFLTYAFIAFPLNPRTTITITDKNVTVPSYTDNEVILNGQTDLHLTATTNPLTNSVLDLNTVDSWIFFDNIKPSFVVDSLLKYININNQPAVLKTNVRISIYKQGTVVIPQSSTFQPLKVYTGQNFSNDSASYSLFTFNNALGLTFDNKIRSLKLKRGYMVTLATNSDGTGYSRVYIAADQDLLLSVMPDLLDMKISFIRVLDWEWVSKKGYCGSDPTEVSLVKPTWRYDWSAGGATTSTVEYVPIRQTGSWPGWSDINALNYVSHVLGFNEPDHTEQSNLTVSQALSEWPDMLRTGLRIGSPACTDFNWLYNFMDSCKVKNYRVDYVAVHAYWGGKSPQNWYNDLKYIHDQTGRPIWITEWNNGANWTSEWWPDNTRPLLLTTANAAKQLSDLKGILQVLDTASFIERYSIYNWVEDARAMVLNGALTPAGTYYSNDNSVMAFNKVNEVIPTFNYLTPSLAISFGNTKLSLSVTDPNLENYTGCIVEKKTDNGNYAPFFNSDLSTSKTCTDTLNLNAGNKVRYRVRSKWSNGTLSPYSNEVGFDVSNGSDIQYGILSLSNVGWNTLFFKKPFTTTTTTSPAIILGAVTNNNTNVLLTPRVKLISATSRTNIQLAPWAYQKVTTLSNEENVPYLMMLTGDYNFGGLQATAGKVINVSSSWTTAIFTTPFDTIPVVFANQLLATSPNATIVRVRNVTKTGFEAKLQKEKAVTTPLGSETITYFAIKPGIGVMDNRKIIVGRTPDKTVGASYKTIYYGDSIANPIFLSQMQTCNDDTVTAALRCLYISSKYTNVLKQRERSTGVTTTLAETAGWMVINPVSLSPQSVNNPSVELFGFYPNPVKDYIYLTNNITEYFDVEIYNLVGVLVKNIHLKENKIDVSELQPGCYILRSLQHGSTKFIKL
jgi:hypothetical protein